MVELLQKKFLNFVGPPLRGDVPNGYDDPVIEFGDPTVEPPPAELIFGLRRFAAGEYPRIARKQLRMFARFRQALQEPAADDALRLAFHDRAGGRIGVAIFEIDHLAGAVENSAVDDQAFGGNVVNRLEQEIGVGRGRWRAHVGP